MIRSGKHWMASLTLSVFLAGCEAGVGLKTAGGLIAGVEDEEEDQIVITYQPGAKIEIADPEDTGSNYPVALLEVDQVCSGITYYDKNGDLVSGTRDCNGVSSEGEESNINPGDIRAGIIIAGVEGTLTLPEDCSVDGETNCVTHSSFKAADLSGAAAKIVSGETLGGVSGSALSRPADCASEGVIGCVTVADYPSLDKNALTANSARIRDSLTIAGVSGSLQDCTDGGMGCVAVGPTFAAAVVSGAATKIVAGQSLAGINGTAPARPADCSTDGGINCVAVAGFAAANASISPAKIVSGQSVGGVTGTANGVRPSNCAADAELGCVSIAAFPAMMVAGAAAKIAAGETLAGVSGSAGVRPADCSTDGDTGCVAVANFPAVNKVTNLAAANLAKIHTSVTVGGVAGTMASCSTDGGTDCMAVTNFPAVDKNASLSAANLDKIHSSVSVGGVAGTMPSCSGDGETDCMAITNFPAVNKVTNLAAANLAKIHTSVTVGGVAGTMASCSTDGGTDCMAVTNFPAVDKNASLSAANLDKIHTTVSVGGVAGTMPSCSGDGETDCMAITNFPAVNKVTNLAAANLAKIHTTVTVGGVAGTMASCSTDGGTDCMAVTNFPSVDKITNLSAANLDKIHTTVSVAGVAGTMPSCSADGETDCMAVTNFPAVNKVTNLAAANLDKIHTSVSVGGVAGTMPSCSGDNETDCMAVTNFPAVVKANVTAGVVKDGTIIAGVTGDYPSAANPLAGADGTADLDDATFNAKIKTATAFEWFDSAGNRYTGTGDTDLTAANIKDTVDIFGSTGTFGADCTADGATGCITTSRYKSMDTDSSVISAWDIRSGKTAGGIPGNLVFYRNMIAGFDRTTGTGGVTGPDIYDTIEDYNNNFDGTGVFPSTSPAAGWPIAPGANWIRDSLSDDGASGGIASNGLCDGAEACVYKDLATGSSWAKTDNTARNWEAAIAYCEGLSYGGHSDWRLPTTKEIMTAHVFGIWTVAYPLGILDWYYWTATNDSFSMGFAYKVSFSKGYQINHDKTAATVRVTCVR